MSARVSRIVKNTGFLYIRMLLTLVVALYTSRVLLDTLGAEDFGLFHVVAGFVVLAAFLKGSLSGTTQRFIAFELGKENSGNLRNVFSMSVNIHILFALVLLLVGGTVGTFLLPSILTYEEGRATAVVVVFWFALLSFMINISVVPCHAMIVAHEEMKVFAWVSVADAFLKLGIVFLIQRIPYDPLIAYGILVFIVTLLIGLIYVIFVYSKYSGDRYRAGWDQQLFTRLISFSGWTVWGNAASVFANQGTNILLNIFFGPVVNAAKSIGNQASGALNQFVTNLQMAINPQIIKSYSGNDHDYTKKLINYGSKYNFFLIFMLAFPILMRTEDVLNIWLVEPPEYAAIFLRLILINLIIESVSRPLITAAQATGNIRLYQFVVGGILLLNVPLAYVVLRAGYPPASVFILAIGLTLCAATARVVMLKRIFTFSIVDFLKVSISKSIMVATISVLVVQLVSNKFLTDLNLLEFIVFALLTLVFNFSLIWIVGLDRIERERFKSFLPTKSE
ncbi:MAG: oligosaccharide flippase family protein [Idiomarina sp.]|nr:oligosaccharide flippase family protein [Idiomarina sp.]